MTEQRLVHLIDDDDAIRWSAGLMLKTSGYQVKAYASGSEFLKQRELQSGCILLDVRMPDMDGLEVQRRLRENGILLPVIVMTGHGDVSTSVQAMKLGAVDFIEKPFEKAVLIDALEQGFDRLGQSRRTVQPAEDARAKLGVLTPREREVLEGLARGLPNKTIGYDLGISVSVACKPQVYEFNRFA